MPVIGWLAAGVLSLSVIGMIAFTALPAARRFKRECWSDLPMDWKLALYVLLILGTARTLRGIGRRRTGRNAYWGCSMAIEQIVRLWLAVRPIKLLKECR